MNNPQVRNTESRFTNHTSRFLYKLIDDKYLDENGKIKEEYKFKLNFPELGIIDSKIPAKEDEKFDTYLFLPEGGGRKGEGGLRTKGYFKFSYENLMINDECLIMNESKKDNISDKNKIQNPTSKIQHSKKWYIVDHDGNPVGPAPDYIQTQITSHSSPLTSLPLITVITVVYNGEKYLEETIQSVLNQTYDNVEYIIIDGGSTDGTLDIIKKYEHAIDYWVSEKDKGIYDAMNKGIMLSKGQLIGIINSDDFYNIDTIEKVVQKIVNKKIDIIYGNIILVDRAKKFIEKRKAKDWKLFFGMSLNHPAVFVSKELYKMKMYNITYKMAADYEFLLFMKTKNKTFFYLNDILAYMRDGGVSVENKFITKREEKIIKKELLGFFYYISEIFLLIKVKLNVFFK